MSEEMTLARPYAKAVFSLAKTENRLQAWADELALLALLVENQVLEKFIQNQTVRAVEKAAFIIELAADVFCDNAKHLIHILAENNRLLVVPEISRLYLRYKYEAERKEKVQVITAKPLDNQTIDVLQQRLSLLLSKEVEMSITTDENLVGGLIVQMGDRVIDGSIRGRLAAMYETLRQG